MNSQKSVKATIKKLESLEVPKCSFELASRKIDCLVKLQEFDRSAKPEDYASLTRLAKMEKEKASLEGLIKDYVERVDQLQEQIQAERISLICNMKTDAEALRQEAKDLIDQIFKERQAEMRAGHEASLEKVRKPYEEAKQACTQEESRFYEEWTESLLDSSDDDKDTN